MNGLLKGGKHLIKAGTFGNFIQKKWKTTHTFLGEKKKEDFGLDLYPGFENEGEGQDSARYSATLAMGSPLFTV